MPQTQTRGSKHGPASMSRPERLLPPPLLVSIESCSGIGLMVRPEMGWMTTLAGTGLPAV